MAEERNKPKDIIVADSNAVEVVDLIDEEEVEAVVAVSTEEFKKQVPVEAEGLNTSSIFTIRLSLSESKAFC